MKPAPLPTRFAEWPTWLLIIAVYARLLGTFAAYRLGAINLPLATVLLAIAVAWFMSMQHELIHGHPTRWAWLNGLIGYAPFTLWYPYPLYRESHLLHHIDSRLTLPGVDPESTYVCPTRWAQAGPWLRRLLTLRKTFVGRLLIGPPWGVAHVLATELKALSAGDYRHLPLWLGHLTACAVLLYAIERYAGIPAGYYLLAVSWPALSLASVRAFYEHRALPNAPERTVINEGGWFTRWLFLNNNLHAVHHARPEVPWYALPAVYRAQRDSYLRANGGFYFPGGYLELFKAYAFRPIDAPAHPHGRRYE